MIILIVTLIITIIVIGIIRTKMINLIQIVIQIAIIKEISILIIIIITLLHQHIIANHMMILFIQIQDVTDVQCIQLEEEDINVFNVKILIIVKHVILKIQKNMIIHLYVKL